MGYRGPNEYNGEDYNYKVTEFWDLYFFNPKENDAQSLPSGYREFNAMLAARDNLALKARMIVDQCPYWFLISHQNFHDVNNKRKYPEKPTRLEAIMGFMRIVGQYDTWHSLFLLNVLGMTWKGQANATRGEWLRAMSRYLISMEDDENFNVRRLVSRLRKFTEKCLYQMAEKKTGKKKGRLVEDELVEIIQRVDAGWLTLEEVHRGNP